LKKEGKKFHEIVGNASTILLTTHINPDGDGLGSELALARFLEGAGKTVRIINCTPTPPTYRFLDPDGSIETFDAESHPDFIKTADVIIVADTNHLSRLDTMERLVKESPATKICIDHHEDPESFADLYVIDTQTAATGQIVYSLLFQPQSEIPPSIAAPLYVAIMTDTGSFRFPKTDAGLFRITAHLVQCGADPVRLYEQVYERGTPDRTRLLGMVLSGLKTEYDGRLAYLVVTRRMFEETRTSEVDTENFVPFALSLTGVRIGLMFTELPGGGVKISFRSKGDIPINRLAKEFGGNGHKNAAGARVAEQPIQKLIESVVKRSSDFLKGNDTHES